MAHFPHAGTSALGSQGFALCVTACTCIMCYTCARDSVTPEGTMWEVRPGWWGSRRKRKAGGSFKGGS